MAQPITHDNNYEEEEEEALSLLKLNDNNGDRSWRLNFDGYQLSPEGKEIKPPRGIHDCLGVLGNFTYNNNNNMIYTSYVYINFDGYLFNI